MYPRLLIRSQTQFSTRVQGQHRLSTPSRSTYNKLISNKAFLRILLGRGTSPNRRRFNSDRPDSSRLSSTFHQNRQVNNIRSTPQPKLLSNKPILFKQDRQHSQLNLSSKLNFDLLLLLRVKLKISHKANLLSNPLKRTYSHQMVQLHKINLLLRHLPSQRPSHSPSSRPNSLSQCSGQPNHRSNSRAHFHLVRTAQPIRQVTSQTTFTNNLRFRHLSEIVHFLANSVSL